MKSKIYSILLLVALILPAPSVISYFHFQKHTLRKEIKKQIIAGIEMEKLVLFKFSKDQTGSLLKWKHSGEFEYKGEMYDIVDSDECGDTIFYKCWWDNKETVLNKTLSTLVDLATGQHGLLKEIIHNFFTFFQSLYCNELNVIIFQFNDIFENRHFYLFKYKSVITEPGSPPPKNMFLPISFPKV